MAHIQRTSFPTFTVVDRATLQQWLRIDGNVDGQTVDLLLASAVDYLEGQTGRVLASANYTVEAPPTDVVALGLFPLNAVTSVVANLPDGTSQTLALGTDYTVRMGAVVLLSCPATAQTITATCNAGYLNATSVPATLQQAAAVLVSAGYDNRSALDPRTVATVENLIHRYRAVGM